MRPAPSIPRTATRAVLCSAAVCLIATSLFAKDPPKAAAPAAMVGGAVPGGSILSAAVSSVSPLKGPVRGAAAASYAATGREAAITCPLKEDGTFEFKGLKPGKYELRISFPNGPRQTTDTSGAKQTQGTSFGEKVASGMSSAGSNKTSHETAKNSIGNIRAREQGQNGGVNVATGDVNGDGKADAAAKVDANQMPSRISMNVTIGKIQRTIEADGDPIVVEVGSDGALSCRASVNPAQPTPQPSGANRQEPRQPSPPPHASGG